MHFSFDNIQLTVPRTGECELYHCLNGFAKMEALNDCVFCRCSIVATPEKRWKRSRRSPLTAENVNADGEKVKESASRKRRIQEARKCEGRVRAALEDGSVKLERALSPRSTPNTQ